MRLRKIAVLIGIAGLWSMAVAAPSTADEREEARRDRQTGRYARALERLDAHRSRRPGRVGRRRRRPRRDPAGDGPPRRGDRRPPRGRRGRRAAPPEPIALLAELEFERGEWDEARSLTDRAIELDPLCRRARWVDALLLDAKGERAEAVEAYHWFVRDFNARNAEARRDADALCLIGQAAERVLPGRRPRRGPGRVAQRRDQRDL